MLTEEKFVESIVSVADALELEDSVYIGSSIGGNVILQLGDWHPDRFRALIGLECGTVRDITSTDSITYRPTPPKSARTRAGDRWRRKALRATRRETMHLYEQGSNGLFRGDLYYYSVDHDYRDKFDQVNPDCPVYVMNGEYDFTTDPDDAREVAEGIGDQAQAIEEGKLGHFPMSENPKVFKKYLLRVLDDICGEDVDLPDKLTPEDVGIDLSQPELEAD